MRVAAVIGRTKTAAYVGMVALFSICAGLVYGAWVDGLGWIGFDPTNDRIAAEDHIFTAMGRDYADVAPLDGVFHGPGGQRMTVGVDVNPLGA